MKIAIGCDHRGVDLKNSLVKYLVKKGHKIEDFGSYTKESCDYPKFAFKVAKAVTGKKVDKGILICNSGLGMVMAASTVRGIRAANCFNESMARFSREHNDANILVFGAGFIKKQMASRIAATWLKTKFAGGRHLRRVKMFSK